MYSGSGDMASAGATHQVISGMYEVMTWLCAVISTGEASGDGKMMLCIVRVVVGAGHDSVKVMLSVIGVGTEHASVMVTLPVSVTGLIWVTLRTSCGRPLAT